MLVVNCSTEPSDLENYLNAGNINPADSIILDFASSFNKEKSISVKYPSDIDLRNEAHKSALADYVNQMGKFSKSVIAGRNGETIRALKFSSVPLYWLTEISEKHPRTSLVKKLYYFKHLYPLLNYAGKEIAFVLPAEASHFISSIKEYIKQNILQIQNVFFNIKEQSETSFRQHAKNTLAFFKKIRFIGKEVKKIELSGERSPDTLIFTYYPQTWRDELKGDYVLHEIAAYSTELGKRVLYPLFFFDYYDIKGIKMRNNWDPAIFRSFPTFFETIKFHLKFLFLFFSVKKTQLAEKGIDFLNNGVFRKELLNVLSHKKEYLFNYIWFKGYFKGIKKPVKIFYQDEFYVSGRMISAAAKNSGNPNIKTHGVQHGVFYEAHTVYSVTNDELNDIKMGDGLPAPDKFVVWGNYFKNHFLRYNSKSPEFIIPAGNPNYTKLKIDLKSNSENDGKPRILWCTTNKIDVINQYKNIISGFLSKNKNAVITVRCHPQFNYKSFITDDLNGKMFGDQIRFSTEQSIYQDILNSNVVLSSSGSTIFLDAIICNKPVLKLVNEDYYMGDLGEKEMVNIHTDADLLAEIEKLAANSYWVQTQTELVNTDSSQWIKLLQ